MRTFQEILATLSSFWADQGCIIAQPYDLEKGAGTSNPTTFLRALGPEPYKAAYIEPCRRPKDGRYAETPNRTQHYFQYQVILKPSPENILELYLASLQAIGMDTKQHDIRFVHDDWENPTLGAWGLGWEVWIDGMEMTQFTYFQSVAGISLQPITGEITYGLERLVMAIQGVESFFDIKWNRDLTYGDIYRENEIQWSHYNFSEQNDLMWMNHFRDFQQEAKRLVSRHFPIPAYDFVIKASHAFNMLDAKGVISVTERASYIGAIREIAKAVAEEYLRFREKKGFPLLQKKEDSLPNTAPRERERSSNKSRKRALVVEIGVEELPALFVPIAIAQFEKNIQLLFQKEQIQYQSLKVHGTPRRIVLLGTGIQEEIPEEIQERRGPPIDAIWDAITGEITPIGTGFLSSTHLFSDSIEFPTKEAIQNGLCPSFSIEIIKGIQYLFVKTARPKKSVDKILEELLPTAILAIQFPKSMRWGDFSLQFARPIRWLLAMIDETVISFQLEHLTASSYTFGSRSLTGSAQIEIPSAELYESLIEEAGVILDPQKRQEMIQKEILLLLAPYNAKTVETQKVMRQVVHLVEKPFTYLLSFDEAFLKAPKEVLIAEMVEHQKYFPVESGDQKILPYFIIIANRPLNREIEKGNKKVLSARLQDGLFLWNEDKAHTLSDFREKLGSITYQTGAGTLLDKSNRIEQIAADIQKEAQIEGIDGDEVRIAAHLSKADLTTQLVGEFPELQGVVGSHLANEEGFPKAISNAIADHWLPNQDGGALPRNAVGDLISISDKLDTITTFFGLGIKPTSSHDPFALRRSALGIVRLIVEHKIDIQLLTAISIALKTSSPSLDQKKLQSEIFQFIVTRAKSYFQEKGYAKESIEAILIGPFSERETLCSAEEKIQAFEELQSDKKRVKSLQEVIKRCLGQLSSTTKSLSLHETLFVQESEKMLYKALQDINSAFSTYAESKQWKRALYCLLEIQEPIDALFSQVKILSDNIEERERRVALLQSAFDLLHRFGDMKRFLGFK
ncbi:MAG: glycine--tRNA ligase subunit beta [Chlamydia sp.]